VQRNRHTDSVVPNLVFTIANDLRIEAIGATDDRLPSEFDLLGLAAWFDLVADLLRRHAERLSGSQLGAHTIDNFATASQTAGIRSRLTRTAGGAKCRGSQRECDQRLPEASAVIHKSRPWESDTSKGNQLNGRRVTTVVHMDFEFGMTVSTFRISA